MAMKLFDSELKVMEILWKNGEVKAKDIAKILGEEIGWSKTTTYTVIKKCIDKGAVCRSNPHFICKAIINKRDIQVSEANELVDKMFDGSRSMLFSSLLESKKVTREEIEELKDLIKKLEG